MDSSEKSDNQLMREFSECSRAAFDLIARRYQKRLFNFLLRGLIKDRDQAEDIVQQTLIKIYENKFTYRQSHQFSTWAYTICRNYALNLLRNNHTVNIGSVFEEEGPVDLSESLMDNIENRETSAIMKQVLESLDSKYREVITMRFLDELSYEEISKITGKGINTLKSLCRRGLGIIRNELEGMKVEQA